MSRVGNRDHIISMRYFMLPFVLAHIASLLTSTRENPLPCFIKSELFLKCDFSLPIRLITLFLT